MADTTLPALLDTGTHAARPAASAVGTGALYSCTDHDLIYQTDGSSWTTWADLSGSGMTNPMTTAGDVIYGGASGTPTRLAVGTAGQVLTVNAGATAPEWAAAASGGLTLALNEDGSSFANFTGTAGTWASTGSIIQQTNTAATTSQRARYNTKLPIGGHFVYQADIRLPSAGQVAGVNVAGITAFNDGASNPANGMAVLLKEGSGVDIEHDATGLTRTLTATIATDVWYTLRAVSAGAQVTVYLDGAILGTTVLTMSATTRDFIGFRTYNAIADFRNIKLWHPALP